MDKTWKEMLGSQFGATIDMLENAVVASPAELWFDRSQRMELWYIVYHTLFWLDLYLSGAVEGFAPPPPYTLEELDPAGVLPERPYSQDELRTYLDHCRMKCWRVIAELTDEEAQKRCVFSWGEVRFGELLLDNMRHVQEHTAQLNWILGEKINWNPRWVARGKPVDAG